MTTNDSIKSFMAKLALSYVPPSIRVTLIEEPSFLEEFGIEIDSEVSFSIPDVSFRQSVLFEAVRKILFDTTPQEVIDTNGNKWKLNNLNKEGDLPKLTLYSDGVNLVLPNLSVLSPEQSIRLLSLREVASDVNLPLSVQDKWRLILNDRPVTNDELDIFYKEIKDTPIETIRALNNEIASGNINLTTLVPHSRRYFERLVGIYDGSDKIHDFALKNGKNHLGQLAEWKPYDGFLFSLFMSSHSSLTAEIMVDSLNTDEIMSGFSFIEKFGDLTSKVGLIEIGFRIIDKFPEVEPILISLINQIRDDKPDNPTSGFKLLSSLFVFVDGELSRTRLLSKEPPFYRRLAALSQAALIHRQFINSSINIEEFGNWAFFSRVQQFYMQSLADMRLEPRWNPDLATAEQIKADFIGRIVIAANKYEKNIKSDELKDLVLGNKPQIVHSISENYYPYLPGPLEGILDSKVNLPKGIIEAIEKQVNALDVGPSSFIALVNSALIFHVDSDQAEMAARALSIGRNRLANVENKSQLLTIINGLASVAAVARSQKLAETLRIIVRNYRYDPQFTLSVQEAMRIYLVAAASFNEQSKWVDFVGDCIMELSFGKLDNNDGLLLHSDIHHLCNAIPELWGTCGRAEAALTAYNSIHSAT